jgi:hypothetical protein
MSPTHPCWPYYDPVHGVVEIEPQSLWSNLIVNGSFESPGLPSGANFVVPARHLLPWQTTEDSFLIWVSPLPNEQAADGRQHVEVVSLWQTVATIPGEDYRLRFHHAARPGVDSTLSVAVNGQVIRTFAENGSTLEGFQWRRYGTNFTASSNFTTIRFEGVAGNAHVDSVVLERLPLSSTIRVSEVEVCWETVATRVYQVQFRSIVTANSWTDLLPPVQGNGQTNCIKDVVPVGEPQRFYRVITVP